MTYYNYFHKLNQFLSLLLPLLLVTVMIVCTLEFKLEFKSIRIINNNDIIVI